MDAARHVGLETRRLGDRFGKPQPIAKPARRDPLIEALDHDAALRAIVGRLRLDGGHDEETGAWAELTRNKDGVALSLYTSLGRDRAVEIAGAAQSAMRNAGWRTRGAGPTIGQAPGKASGVWTANLSLAPLSTGPKVRVILGR